MKYVIAAAAVGCAIGGIAGTAHADILYGVTRTNLVTIDTNNPGQVQVIGAHGLNITTDGFKSFGAFGLTYNRGDGKLYGLHYEYDTSTGNFDQSLVSYDMNTGQASVTAYLGNSAVEGYFEAIEYVDTENSLVVSSGVNVQSQTYTEALYALDLDGSTTRLSVNGRDNDYGVYDHTRDAFYTIDPNGVGHLTAVGVRTGVNFDIGRITGGISALAYSESDDAIFSYDVWSQELVRMDSFRGVNALTLTDLGLVPTSDIIQGMAFVVPSPASLMLLSAGGLVICSRRRR